MQEQDTVDIECKNTTLKARGRHDPCVLPRAVPVVEAMTALVLVDHALAPPRPNRFGGELAAIAEVVSLSNNRLSGPSEAARAL